MKKANRVSGESRYWASYATIMVLLIGVCVYSLDKYRDDQIQEFKYSLSADIEFLCDHVAEDLQGDYKSIGLVIQSWIDRQPGKIIKFKLTTLDGYELINYLRKTDSQHRVDFSEIIPNSYFETLQVEVAGDLSKIDQGLVYYYWLIGIINLLLSIALAVIIQLAVKKRRISFLLLENSRNLNKINIELSQSLHIIDSNAITVFSWKNEPGWPIEWVSRNVEDLTGYTAEEFISGDINYSSLIFAEDSLRVKQENQKYNDSELSKGTSNKLYRITTKFGTEKWVEDRSNIVRGLDGEITHYHGIVIDISDRIRSEEKLKDSELRYRSILEQTSDALFIQDLDGKIIETNNAACMELGFSLSELLGMKFNDILEDPNKVNLKNGIMSRLEQGHTVTVASKLKRKNGSMYPAEIRLGLIQLNKRTLVLGFARDLSDRLESEQKRLRAEQVYRTLFNSAPDPIMIHDGHKILDGNPSLLRSLGLKTKKELLSMEPLSLLHPDDHERAMKRAAEILDNKTTPKPAEFKFQLKSGEVRIAMASPVPIMFNGTQAVMVNYHDITERKRNERELRKLAMVVQQSPASIVITDTKGDIEYVNPKFEELTGFSRGEILGKNPSVLKGGEQPDEYYKDLWSKIKSGKTWSGEFQNKKKNGDLYWESAQISPIIDENGSIRQYLAIKEDITERKKAEELTRDLGQIIEESLSEIYLFDAKSLEYIYLNKGAETNLGYPKKELLKLTPLDIQPHFNLDSFKEMLLPLENEDLKHLKFETIQRRADGTEYPVSVHMQLTSYLGNETYLVMVRDISERKAAMEKQVILEAQLRQSQKLEAVGTMAGGIAHDFNNILQVQSLYTGIIKEQFTEDEQFQSNLHHVIEAGDRAKDLVKQILTFSRKEDSDLKPTKIQYLIKDALKLTRSTTPSSIEIQDRIDGNCGAILCDATQLHQVFVNLCNNAVYAMRDVGGILTVSLQETGHVVQNEIGEVVSGDTGSVALVVSDTGEGMSAETLQHIFDPFFTTKGVGEGTGLGLSIVHGIIKDMQGQIKVESEPGKGTTLTIFMPLCAKEEILETVEYGTGSSHANGRILFVDDEATISWAGKHILEKEGYEVTLAANGVEALEHFQNDEGGYDLIITDLTMPKMNGLELGEAIRKLSEDVTILLTSGNLDPELQTAFEDFGFNGFIRKPWSADDILRVINSLDLKEAMKEGQADG